MRSRREFMRDSMIAVGSSCLVDAKLGASPSRGVSADYIRKEIPAFEIPAYKGARYDDHVPDTLDIAERARLGVNCQTGITDPDAENEIYFYADFFRNPPVMVHDFSDWCQNVEGMMESLPLLRVASGSSLNDHVDQVWMETLLKSIGPDGLVYYPLNGRPWARLNHAWVTPLWRADGTTTNASDKSVAQVTNPSLWPRAMAAMSVYYLRDQNPMWKQHIEKMIAGMTQLASDQGDYCFFPAGGYEPGKKFSAGWAAGEQVMPTGYLALDGGNGRVIQGLAQYFRLTGYEPARDLAEKLVRFVRFRADSFDAEGRFRFSAFEKNCLPWFLDYSRKHGGNVTWEEVQRLRIGGHFHCHTIAVLAVLEYALAAGDRDSLAWCKSSFEWSKSQGSSLVGFFPEFVMRDYPSCESCEVADMIALAVKLSLADVGDYWDDVDRWTRNQFAENQLTDGDWIDRHTQSLPAKPVAYNETAEKVAARNMGAFAGWASGNEWALHNGIMHCCTGNSTRTLYYVWKNIVEAQGDEFKLNLLLNHASSWADVYSYIPYEGRVSVKMKRPCQTVRLRAPEWVESGNPQLVCKVNSQSRQVAWEGRYVKLGAAKPGETIEMTFPIATRTVRETLGSVRYNLEIRGSTVVSIDPPGERGPLYNRSHYKSPEAPSRVVQRFVADSAVSW